MQDQDRREEISASRRRVLDAAYTLFVEQGYKAISMQQIANAAQINKATLYHHFRSKDDLFAAVVVEALARSQEDITSAIAQGGTPSDQLTRVAMKLFARSRSDIGRLMTDVHEQVAPAVRNHILSTHSMPWEMFREIFRQASRDGDLPEVPVELAVSLFIGMVWGQIWMRKIAVVDFTLDETLASSIVSVLFAGLRGATPLPDPVQLPAN